MPATGLRRPVRAALGAAALGAMVLTAAAPVRTVAATTSAFAAGVPTVVDPIRAAGEPDIAVDNNNNALITGPGGSGTQTSWFWRTRDGGLTYPLLGPSGGHYICPASGGGDSLVVTDRATNNLYLTDQEAWASLGTGLLKPDNSVTAACATAPAISADRPFEAVLPTGNATAPQSVADGKKPIVYLSWLCDACTGSGATVGGLAFGWTDDGVTFHPADPGVVGDMLVTNGFQEAGAINNFQWHGPMVADPKTGYVYTALSCNGGSCPNSASDNEFGVAIGKPFANPTTGNPSNLGEFQSLTYQAAVKNVADPGSLFPVLTMDSAGTLYLLWTQGDGFADPTQPVDSTSWHIEYSYSLDSAADGHTHTTWSAPIRVDQGSQTATSAMGWIVAGDPGKLGFIWLGTAAREHPSKINPGKLWYPFMAVTSNGNTASPTFQQAQVGTGANHVGDICLQGTVGCIQNVGNRNMADFISVDIGPDGALQGTWANDSNQLATQPTTLIPGLPITETARQVSGPQLIGSGSVSDSRFSTTPTTTGITDATGDALYPVQGGTNVKQLDLTSSTVAWDGSNVVVTMSVADASSLASPDSSNQSNVWWLTTWQFNHKIYFAKAQSSGGGAISCTAGLPATYDRPGLNGQTVATLADYSGGTAESKCALAGNTFTITVPAGDVGGPAANAVLESTTAYSVLDNGLPPVVAPGPGNVPTVIDATPAYDALLAAPATTVPEAPLSAGLLVGGAAVAGLLYVRRRRRLTLGSPTVSG